MTKPCNTCESCKAFKKNTHPDFVILNKSREEEITIAEIRSLKGALSKSAFYNSYKIVIINPSENLSRDASHSLLKILEEPPQKTLFILISETINSLLPTILSRVETIPFQRLKKQTIIDALENHYSDEQKQFIAKRAAGKIGAALSWSAEKIKASIEEEKKILTILKAPSYQKIILIEKFVKKNEIKIRTATRILRDLLLTKLGLSNLTTSHYLRPEYQKIAAKFSLVSLKGALTNVIKFPQEYKNNTNKLLLWHTVFLNLN
jgi:DNA polymerase-3 subunit delta'